MARSDTRLGRQWDEFWQADVAAERLALVRITTCIALVADIVLQHLPFYAELFSLHGMQPEGYSDVALLRSWRWTAYVFSPSGVWLGLAFASWLAACIALAVGFHTRAVAVCVWFLTLAMLNRHYYLKNFGDSVLRFTTFMLMFVPCRDALAWDAWRKSGQLAPTLQPAWGVRLFQLQLCAVYAATGISKLIGPLSSTWYQGTSVHYALNDVLLARLAYPLLPLPLSLTLPLSYLVLAWEVLFVPLVIWPRSRRFALGFGLVFHLVSFVALEIGWFPFYILAWYCAWLPDEWFTRVFYPRLWSLFPRLRSATPSTL